MKFLLLNYFGKKKNPASIDTIDHNFPLSGGRKIYEI